MSSILSKASMILSLLILWRDYILLDYLLVSHGRGQQHSIPHKVRIREKGNEQIIVDFLILNLSH